ncbi:MAG: nucleotidyltransferase [Marinilabiliales bacterium]|nr:MAG: nucleotidyltransferase [Marinilabiliales bacterium]
MSKPTLLILAAGLGSRYGSLKQIEPIGPHGEAIIDYSVYDAIKAGFGKVVFVIKKDIEIDFKESLLARFRDKVETGYVFQELDMLPGGYKLPPNRVKPWGTAHAIMVSEKAVTTPFAAINADDYYGYEAFSEMHGFLQTGDTSKEYCMIGYRLDNTLSDHGTVSRGVCSIDRERFLISVSELTKIKREKGKIFHYENGEPAELSGSATVSMNMWGFGTSVFGHIRQRFSSFLDFNINDPKAEFYIPTLVDQLINDGEIRVRVLDCNSTWFGITYKEDRDAARNSILEKIRNGEYPENLWQ